MEVWHYQPSIGVISAPGHLDCHLFKYKVVFEDRMGFSRYLCNMVAYQDIFEVTSVLFLHILVLILVDFL